MALQWDLSKILNAKEVCWGEDLLMKPLTHSLIWATISVDIGEITEENALEFTVRDMLLRDLYGSASLYKTPPFTLEEVRSHIGLKVNVITLTRAKWISKLAKNNIPSRLRDYQYRLENEARMAKQEAEASTV